MPDGMLLFSVPMNPAQRRIIATMPWPMRQMSRTSAAAAGHVNVVNTTQTARPEAAARTFVKHGALLWVSVGIGFNQFLELA